MLITRTAGVEVKKGMAKRHTHTLHSSFFALLIRREWWGVGLATTSLQDRGATAGEPIPKIQIMKQKAAAAIAEG